jgi:hypothetical protein
MLKKEPLTMQVEVVIVEPNPSGHRLQYVRHIALAVGDHRWAWLSSKAAVGSAERKVHLGDLRPRAISTVSGSRRGFLKQAVELARCLNARRVIVPDGDKYLPALLSLSHSWTRSSPDLSVLLMRTAAPSVKRATALRLRAKRVASRIANRMPNVHLRFLTDGFGVVQSRPGYEGIAPAPDPVSVRHGPLETSSGTLSIPTNRLAIGILGGIGLRKNPSVLIEAAAGLPEMVVVLAGKMTPDVRALAANNRFWSELREAGRLVELDRLLTFDEFDALLKQLTAVAVLHDNDAPSGILAEAAARGTPAIVASGGWLEQIVTTLGFGLATEVSADGVRAVLESFEVHKFELELSANRVADQIGSDAFVEALLH